MARVPPPCGLHGTTSCHLTFRTTARGQRHARASARVRCMLQIATGHVGDATLARFALRCAAIKGPLDQLSTPPSPAGFYSTVSTTTTLPCSHHRGPPLLAHLAAESSACAGSRAPPHLGGAPRPNGTTPCPPEHRRTMLAPPRIHPLSEQCGRSRPILLYRLRRTPHPLLLVQDPIRATVDLPVDCHHRDTAEHW
jgi:hypothetical protein